MVAGRALFIAVYGFICISALTIILSLVANLYRQFNADSAPAGGHYNTCGEYGDCDDFDVHSIKTEEGLQGVQRGLRTYMQYCVGCHSLSHSRYNRIAKDLQIPQDIFEEELLRYNGASFSALVNSRMWTDDAVNWFGVSPPDLSLVTRYKKPEWVYTFLRSFYNDSSRPTGYNNHVFAGVGMPNIMEKLQGNQELGCVMQPYTTANGGEARDPITGETLTKEVCNVLQITEPGRLTTNEFDEVVRELTSFLVYVAEPYAEDRKELGVYVLLWLTIFSILAGLLYREYKKDYPKITS